MCCVVLFWVGKYKWEEGRVSGAVYAADAQVADLCTQVHQRQHYSIVLYTVVFPSAQGYFLDSIGPFSVLLLHSTYRMFIHVHSPLESNQIKCLPAQLTPLPPCVSLRWHANRIGKSSFNSNHTQAFDNSIRD